MGVDKKFTSIGPASRFVSSKKGQGFTSTIVAGRHHGGRATKAQINAGPKWKQK